MPKRKKTRSRTQVKSREKRRIARFTREDVLKDAKKLGLFKFNKYYRVYEIKLPYDEYKAL